jgi:hypothetical protein
MVTKYAKGEAFQPGEVWRTRVGGFYLVMAHEDKPGKRKQAVLRAGADGNGRKVMRDWDAVSGWSIVPELQVVEVVFGNRYYHLARPDAGAVAICGARTMKTSIQLKAWGKRGHLNERWCEKCARLGSTSLAAAGAKIEEPALVAAEAA